MPRTREDKLVLDPEANEYLRMGHCVALVAHALCVHPEIVVQWQDGKLTVGNCAAGAAGCILQAQDFATLLGYIEQEAARR